MRSLRLFVLLYVCVCDVCVCVHVHVLCVRTLNRAQFERTVYVYTQLALISGS